MAATIPNNLPLQLSSFIGREREIAEVRGLLATARLVTLTGAGGCGKTRLALEVGFGLCHDAPNNARFGDGIWFIDLAPLPDHAMLANRIATVLDIAGQAGQP